MLVRAIATGDQLALHALYERAHRPVFTLLMRITASRETAEDLTVDVFHDVWRRAPGYDAANGWTFSPLNVVTIVGGSTAVVGTGLNTPTMLQDLTIRAADATGAGASSYGVYLTSSTAVASTAAMSAGSNGT